MIPIATTSTMVEAPKPSVATQENWRAQLRDATRNVGELLRQLSLAASDFGDGIDLDPEFPLLVPRPYLDRMRSGDPDDALLRQVLPRMSERIASPGYFADPLNEESYNPAPGVVHKYHARALIVVASGCAVHCRYCFRRASGYSAMGAGHVDEALRYVDAHQDISEVILSGGDPLMMDDPALEALVQRIAAIPHIKRLRVHTRLPVVIPERITDALARSLSMTRLQSIVVLHINHPQEVDDALQVALLRLARARIPLMNQSVLLRGVNDSSATLAALSERLFESNVLPYYLHLLDPVEGAGDFDVDDGEAQRLYDELLTQLPGYLVPRMVREVPGAAHKVPLSPTLAVVT